MAHIRKLATGRYQVRYRDPDKRERARNFRRRVDADRFMHEVEVRKARGSYLSPELAKTPFGEWAKQVERSRVNRRASTRIRDDALLRNHVIPWFGSRAIASIRASDIQTWISDLEGRRYAPATIHKAYQILSRALRAAELDGMIARSPLLGIVLPKIEHSSMRFLDPQEVVELADTIDPRFRVLVLTAAGTGLRWGELAALDLSHLNLLRRTATVDCTLTEVGGQVSRSAPKTATARRTVSLSEFLVAELEEHLARHPDPDSFVFSSPAGGPLRRNNFRRRFWLPAVRAAGLSPLRFHDMRHTHVALLIKQGEQPNTIAARLGHRSVRTVLDVYGHLYDGMDRSAADSLDGPFREALADSTRTLERVIALGDG